MESNTIPPYRDGNTIPSYRDSNTIPSDRDGNTIPSDRDGNTIPSDRDGNTIPRNNNNFKKKTIQIICLIFIILTILFFLIIDKSYLKNTFRDIIKVVFIVIILNYYKINNESIKSLSDIFNFDNPEIFILIIEIVIGFMFDYWDFFSDKFKNI